MTPRKDIGRTLGGDVLEIGPGHEPFPTADDARVTYADRSVPGGRDATWPELADEPRGPDADLEIDLDVDGLAAVVDESFDVVVASHLIEHLANPIAALREFERALRPGGRLVLVIPDRTRTFDSVRAPTPMSHVLDEFDRQVTEVDAAHIEEFCAAIYGQPPIHPPEVREWHNPDRLDADRLDLHRRRSIHAHCWTPEEFAVLVAGCIARGLMAWRLSDLYFFDEGDPAGIEFGLVLERPRRSVPAADGCVEFVRAWVARVLEVSTRDPERVVGLQAALIRDFRACDDLARTAPVAVAALAAAVVTARDAVTAADEQRRDSTDHLEGVLQSRTYRAARILGAPLRLVRRRRS